MPPIEKEQAGEEEGGDLIERVQSHEVRQSGSSSNQPNQVERLRDEADNVNSKKTFVKQKLQILPRQHDQPRTEGSPSR